MKATPVVFSTLILALLTPCLAGDEKIDTIEKAWAAIDEGKGANVLLVNNLNNQAIDPKSGRLKGQPAGAGRLVNPTDVIVTSAMFVPANIVTLYSSITKLPPQVKEMRIFYAHNPELKKGKLGIVSEVHTEPGKLLGILLYGKNKESPKWVPYSGEKEWQDWILKEAAGDHAESKAE